MSTRETLRERLLNLLEEEMGEPFPDLTEDQDLARAWDSTGRCGRPGDADRAGVPGPTRAGGAARSGRSVTCSTSWRQSSPRPDTPTTGPHGVEAATGWMCGSVTSRRVPNATIATPTVIRKVPTQRVTPTFSWR